MLTTTSVIYTVKVLQHYHAMHSYSPVVHVLLWA